MSDPEPEPPVVRRKTGPPNIDPVVPKPGPAPKIPDLTPTISVSVVRPRDLLVLDFKFINFQYVAGPAGQPGTLQRAIDGKDAFVVVTFPQQSIREKAFFESDPNISVEPGQPDPPGEEPTANTPPIPAAVSGFSRLVFELPVNAKPIPFTVEGLLRALRDLPLRVAPTALPPRTLAYIPGWVAVPKLAGEIKAGWRVRALKAPAKGAGRAARVKNGLVYAQAVGRAEGRSLARELARYEESREALKQVGRLVRLKPKLAPPGDLETSIEAPFRLILSPNSMGAWVHSLTEVTAVHKTHLTYWPGGLVLPSQPPALPKLVVDGIKGSKKVAKWPVPAKPAVEMAEISRILNLAVGTLGQPIPLPELHPWYENVDWVELWHTRLATRLHTGEVDEGPSYLRTVRALWARDAAFTVNVSQPPQPFNSAAPTLDDPYRSSLDACDRFNIVHLSANYRLTYEAAANVFAPYDPLPVAVDRMMLSTLGSWLNVRGVWSPLPQHLSVEEWRHRSTMARDHYVRVVYKGYLFPFGHHASLVKVTERKFHGHLPGNPAYERQRMFIVVREPERTYVPTGLTDPANTLAGKKYDYAWPFTRVRITTLVTPLLDPPENSDIGGQVRLLFRPVEGSNHCEVRFHAIAEDLDGRKVEFSTPLIFVDNQLAGNLQRMSDAQTNFTEGSDGLPPAAPAELAGQAVSFAAGQVQGDTTLSTEKIWFGAQVPDDANFTALKTIYTPDIGRFYPRIEQAAARIPAIQVLAGNNALATFKFPDAYLRNGFDVGNEGQVFVELLDNAAQLTFAGQGQRSGGLLAPEMQINGISTLLGPVGGATGDLADITSGAFDPVKFFAGVNPKLFGVIPLMDIVIGVASAAGEPDAVPRFISQSLAPIQRLMTDLSGLGDRVEGMVTAEANALKTELDTVINRITAILAQLPGSIQAQSWTDLTTALGAFAGSIDAFLDTLKDPSVPATVRIPIEGPLTGLKSDLADAQKFVDDLKAAVQLITDQKVSLDWKPTLSDWVLLGATIFDTRGGQAYLHLHAEADARSTLKGNPSFLVSCGLEKFNLNLIGKDSLASFMILHFGKVEFVYSDSQKADVNVDLEKIEFVGVLSFVEALKSLIPLDGFKDPPGLDISAKGISASYTLALPDLAFGIFSLCNLSLSAGFSVPFIGDPISVRFAFCTRENPFTLTVSLFGGGGFFGITLQPDGLQLLEASFEFGASLSVNFGVASGGVHIMAGIYFKMDQKSAALTGYFRMGGKVDVLGLISASIELYLSLTYEFSSGKCVGKAELTIEVSVLFFSVSVTITCERKFAGSSGDPTFAQLMAPYADPVTGSPVDPWVQYCEAFA